MIGKSIKTLDELAKIDNVNDRDRIRCLNQNLITSLAFCAGGALPIGYVLNSSDGDLAGWKQVIALLFGAGVSGIGIWSTSKTLRTYLDHFRNKEGEEGYAYLDGKISDRITAVETSFGHQIIPVDSLEVLSSHDHYSGFNAPFHFLDCLTIKHKNGYVESGLGRGLDASGAMFEFSDDRYYGNIHLSRLGEEKRISYNFGNKIPQKFAQLLETEGEFSLLFKQGKYHYEGDHQILTVQGIYPTRP